MYPVQKELKKQLKFAGLTIRETADYLGIKPSTLSARLNGYCELSKADRLLIQKLISERGE